MALLFVFDGSRQRQQLLSFVELANCSNKQIHKRWMHPNLGHSHAICFWADEQRVHGQELVFGVNVNIGVFLQQLPQLSYSRLGFEIDGPDVRVREDLHLRLSRPVVGQRHGKVPPYRHHVRLFSRRLNTIKLLHDLDDVAGIDCHVSRYACILVECCILVQHVARLHNVEPFQFREFLHGFFCLRRIQNRLISLCPLFILRLDLLIMWLVHCLHSLFHHLQTLAFG
mmetsp:Transcript_26832/g.65107  ORF Transcript_26832/g.65107 Transcript_26832/m.65107 type:complete len:227 (+) Transcript_26832:1585-2265(+)